MGHIESSSEHMMIFLRYSKYIIKSSMSWHKLSLKVIDVLALLGHRCLGTHQLFPKLEFYIIE